MITLIALIAAVYCIGWTIWAHGLLVQAVRIETRKDLTVATVNGVRVVIQPKYTCDRCNDTLREESIFFGMQLYQCPQGHRYIGRGKGRLTPLSTTMLETVSYK